MRANAEEKRIRKGSETIHSLIEYREVSGAVEARRCS
jgi:hypothetical protein